VHWLQVHRPVLLLNVRIVMDDAVRVIAVVLCICRLNDVHIPYNCPDVHSLLVIVVESKISQEL
jgi:hypothetical protein